MVSCMAMVKIRNLVVILIGIILLSGCGRQHEKTILCHAEEYNCYDAMVPEILPDYEILHAYQSAFLGLKQGSVVETSAFLAIPALELESAGYWYPQYLATVVIAVDREQTDATIHGWKDLSIVNETVGMSDRLPEVRLLMAALSFGLEGNLFTLKQSSDLLANLYKSKQLAFNNYYAPVLICFDYQAVQMNKTGRKMEIIIPSEGTLTFEKGLLSKKELTLSNDTEMILQEAGFRILDGNNLDENYPDEEYYAKAVFPIDYKHLTKVCENVTYVLKRDVRKISSYIYSSRDGRNQQFFALLFIIIVILWTGFLLRRTMQKGVKRASLLAVTLIIFWVLVRMFKYQIPLGILNQYCWYGYYLFQLGIALVLLWMAGVIDKPERDFYLPHWWMICAAVDAVLFLLIMTNNWHHLAFVFRPDDPAYSVNYTYGPVYYATMAAIFMQIFAILTLLIQKSWKSPRKMVFLFPVIFYGLLGLYGVCYILRVPFIWETDLTIVSGSFIVILIEICIRIGLIPVNTKYKDLFEHSPLQMQIVGASGEVVHASRTAASDKKGVFFSIVYHANDYDENSLLYQGEITGGMVIWKEDISNINRLNKEIDESIVKLKAINAMLMEEERIKSHLAATEARTALLSELDTVIKQKNSQLSKMVEQLEEYGENQNQTAVITLLLCYIKRRSILFFREQETPDIVLEEIIVYLDELREFAFYTGIKLHISAIRYDKLPIRQAILFYDFVFSRLEGLLREGGQIMLVQIVQEQNVLILKTLQSDLSKEFIPEETLNTAIYAASGFITSKNIDDTVSVCLSFQKGGIPDA